MAGVHTIRKSGIERLQEIQVNTMNNEGMVVEPPLTCCDASNGE
jgi:hypothetical protein